MLLVEMALSKIVRSTIYITIALLLFNPVIAKSDTITIVAPLLGERLFTKDKKGFWADMSRQILTDLTEPHSLIALPFKRALAAFKSDDFDCIWLFDKTLLGNLGVDVTGLIESESVFESTQHIFLSPRIPMISSLADLGGKRVGIGSGSNYEPQLRNASAKLVLLSDQSSKIRMLDNDRLDAFIGWLPDQLIVATNDPWTPNLLKHSLKLSSTGTTFVCHNTISNSTFIKNIDSTIKAYRTSDTFTALFETYGASLMLEDHFK